MRPTPRDWLGAIFLSAVLVALIVLLVAMAAGGADAAALTVRTAV